MDITFSNDPKLYILLPFIYFAWQDDLLANKEMKIITDLIDGQEWLTKAEKEFLKSKINTASPPARSELFHWREKINAALENTKPANLTELGILIANHEREAIKSEDISSLAGAFAGLESGLGIMSREVIAGFRQNRDTVTNKHSTTESFSVSKMTALLDGSQSEIINKVKELIGSEDLALDIPTDIMQYREKVLQWSKILADHGLGSYAYPKAHGGKDDIQGYFSIMETLSYHDLSLVI
ncbi:MAG: acyl-CoA dehydrogenase, partial [Flavobacterium sp.]